MTRRGFPPEDWGLGGVFSESGQLDRPIDANLLLVPGFVEIKGNKLVWQHEQVVQKQLAVAATDAEREELLHRFTSHAQPNLSMTGDGKKTILVQKVSTHPPRTALPGPRLLEGFVRLADAPDSAIRDYAQQWGILGICKHDLPRTHNFQLGSPDRFCSPLGFRMDEECKAPTGWEPLSTWRRYAREARATLDIAANIHQGKPVLDEDIWRAAGIDFPRELEDESDSTLCRRQAFDISVNVNGWLEMAHVRPLLSWGSIGPATVMLGTTIWWFHRDMQRRWLPSSPHMQGTSLFGALAAQLLMTVSRTAGLALCSACGTLYTPKRRPNPNRRRYCPACGIKAAWRDAQAMRRVKSAKQRK